MSTTGKVATKSTKVVAVATKPRKTPAPPENGAPTPAEILDKKKAEEKKAVEAFLKNGNKVITTKKEAVMSAKKEETTVKAVAKKAVKKATNKKEVAPMKKAVKKTVTKAPVKATNKKEAVMKGKGKGSKKVEVAATANNFKHTDTAALRLAKKTGLAIDKVTSVFIIASSESIEVFKLYTPDYVSKCNGRLYDATVFIRDATTGKYKAGKDNDVNNVRITVTSAIKEFVKKIRDKVRKNSTVCIKVNARGEYKVFDQSAVRVCLRKEHGRDNK